jgi:hypothetical protein
MVKLLFCIVFSLFAINCCWANEWVAYSPLPINPTIAQTQPLIQQSYYTIVSQPRTPILVYELIPYIFNKPILTERYGIFCQHRTVTYEPSVIWIYQPIWK